MTQSKQRENSGRVQASHKRGWRAYCVAMAVSLALASTWFIGPDASLWAASQQRPMNEFPALTLGGLRNADSYTRINLALDDRLRAKYPIVKFLGEAALVTAGLPLSSRMTSGNPLPSLFPEAGIETPLFFGHDFTLPCSRNPELMRSAMQAWESALQASGKQGIFVIPPNKSTVTFNRNSMWGRALMNCSVAGRADLEALERDFSSLHVISPEEVRAMSPAPPYSPGDTHWTSDSAKSLVAVTQGRFPGILSLPAEDVAPHEIVINQDLLVMLGIYHPLSATSQLPGFDSINLKKIPTQSGANVWTFATVGARAAAPTALLIVDSFVYGTDITAKFLSQFKSGYMIQAAGIAEIVNFDPVDFVVVETVERYSYQNFEWLGGPILSEYIAGPVK